MKLSTRLRMLSPAEHDPHLIKAIMLAAADEIDRLANAVKVSSDLWERIMDACVADIMALSDEEILKEAAEDGDDVHAIAERARERIKKAMEEAQRRASERRNEQA